MAMFLLDAAIPDQQYVMLAGLLLGLGRPYSGRKPYGLYPLLCCLRNKLGSGIGPAKNDCHIQSNWDIGKLGVGFESINFLEIRSHGNHIVAHPME